MLSDTTAAEAAQHTQLITLNQILCCLVEIKGELHLVGKATGRQRIPRGRKSGFSGGSVLETSWGCQTRLHPCNSVGYIPKIAGLF